MNVCPVLVGRESELAALEEALQQRGVMVITGEAGIGKSRLLREFAQQLEAEGPGVLWGRPEVLVSATPFSVIEDLLEEARGSSAARAEALDALSFLRQTSEPAPRHVAARVRGVLSLAGPTAVIFEDLHDADEMSLAVVGHLMRAAADDEILLIGTHRPESSPALDRVLDMLRRDQLGGSLRLRPLADTDVRTIVREMWSREPSDEEFEGIARLAEGVPLYAEELSASGGGVIPESIMRAVTSRLRDLDAEAADVIGVASLIQGAIDPGLIAAVLEFDESALGQHLVAAVRAGLLTEVEGRLAFRHRLIREAVAQGLVSLERQRLHLALAEAMMRRPDLEFSAHAAAVARHLSEGGQLSESAIWCVRAGRAAVQVAALEQGRQHFHLALERTSDKVVARAAREGLSEIAARIDLRDPGEWEALAIEYEEAGDQLAASRCWLRSAEIESRMHGTEAALVRFERARSGLDESEPAALAQVLIEMAAWGSGGNLEDSRVRLLFDQGLALARKAGRGDLAAEALVSLGRDHRYHGDIDRALDLERRGCDEAIATRNGDLISRLLRRHAWTCLQAGRGDECYEVLDEAEHWARVSVGVEAVAAIELQRGMLHYELGRPARAGESAALSAASPNLDMVAVPRAFSIVEAGNGGDEVRSYLGALWQMFGDETHREMCLVHPEEVLERSPMSIALCHAEFLIADGSGAEPVEWWRDVATGFRAYYAGASPSTQVEMLIALGRLAWRLGDTQSMEAALAEMDAPLRLAPYPPFLAAQVQLKGLLIAQNSAPEASDLWKAADMLWSVASVVEAARSCRVALELDGAPDEPSQALCRSALERAQSEGAVLESSRLEAAMRKAGLRTRAGRPRGRPRVAEGDLSVREQEVAVLVAAGASNAEIANRLVLSERTVEDHISRAQRRLGVAGRAGLATWAAKRGLI